MRIPVLQPFLNVCATAGESVYMQAEPGVGKTHLTHTVARAMGGQFCGVRATQLDIVDSRGLPVTEGGLTRWARPDWLPTDPAWRGLILVDELPAAPPAIQGTLYELFEKRPDGSRWLAGHRLPDGALPIGAGNRLSDRAVANRLSSALISRLAIVNVQAHPEDWAMYAIGHVETIPTLTPPPDWEYEPEILAFHQAFPDCFSNFERWLESQKTGKSSGGTAVLPVADNEPYACPRSWERLNRFLKTWRHNRVSIDTRAGRHTEPSDEMVAAFVGNGVATAFNTFVRNIGKLPGRTEVLASPGTALVPEEPDLCWAIIMAASRWATPENFDRLLAYTDRLPKAPNFQSLFVAQTLRHARVAAQKAGTPGSIPMLRTMAYIKWTTQHPEFAA